MKTLFRYLRVLLRWAWKLLNFARQLVLNAVFIGFALGIIIVITQELPIEKQAVITTDKPRALLLNIAGPIVEKRQAIAPFDFASRNLLTQRKEGKTYSLIWLIKSAPQRKMTT